MCQNPKCPVLKIQGVTFVTPFLTCYHYHELHCLSFLDYFPWGFNSLMPQGMHVAVPAPQNICLEHSTYFSSADGLFWNFIEHWNCKCTCRNQHWDPPRPMKLTPSKSLLKIPGHHWSRKMAESQMVVFFNGISRNGLWWFHDLGGTHIFLDYFRKPRYVYK